MTNYPPELIEDFEKLAKEQRWDTARDYDDCFIDPQMPKALAAFAHNWHRVRELEETLETLSDCVLDDDDSRDFCKIFARQARKLLEKGNE